MTYDQLSYLHLAAVLPAFLIGTWLMVRRKGTPVHRVLGRLYLVLMAATAVIALCMPARLGPTVLGHFGLIHLLCLLTLYAVPRGHLAARRGDIATHRTVMVVLYVGALLVAGAFAFSPGRLLHGWLFGTAQPSPRGHLRTGTPTRP